MATGIHPNGEADRTLPIPSTERLLRGVRTALADINVSGRPDLEHTFGIIDQVLTHLLLRQNPQPYAELYSRMVALALEGARFLGTPGGAAQETLRARIHALHPTLPAGLSFDAVQSRIGTAFSCLSDLLRLAVSLGAQGREYARKVQGLEQQFYESQYRPTPHPRSPSAWNQETFQQYVLQRFPGKYRAVSKFQRLTGGLQKDTILVDLDAANGHTESVVIRAEKHDRFVRFTASEITDEYEIVRVLWDAGIRVAEPLWLEADAGVLGRRFMVSRRVVGRNTGDAMGSAKGLSQSLTRSLVRTLAEIHAVPLTERVGATKLGQWLQHESLAANTLAEVRGWRHQIWLPHAPASPSFTRIFDWLEANVPADDASPCILHNDYGSHNLLVDEHEVKAVLDWEVPRIGDPAEDVSYLLRCYEGAIGRDEALAVYREFSKHVLSDYRLRYFDALNAAKVLVSALSATTMYQATEPALIDWSRFPIAWMAMWVGLVEEKIQAAEQVRGS